MASQYNHQHRHHHHHHQQQQRQQQQQQQRKRDNALSIRQIVNDESLHNSERYLPRPSAGRAAAAAAVPPLSSASIPFSSAHSAHSYNSSTSTSASRRGSHSNESSWTHSSSLTGDDPMSEGYDAAVPSLQSSFYSSSPHELPSPTWFETPSDGDMDRLRRRAEDRFSKNRAPMLEGTKSSEELKRKLHASRQGARRSQNRAVLSISLAQNRIDSAYKPISTLSSYNKQQSGRDVKETEVINVSTMTSAAKTRVFQDITSSMSQKCQDALYGIDILSQRVDPSLRLLVHEIRDKIQAALDCAIDKCSARERVGSVVRCIQPLYEALIQEVQEHLNTDNRGRGESTFDVQAYLEHESRLFWEMRTGLTAPSI